MIYLDNAATTKTHPRAAQAAFSAMENDFGNPSSLHRLGLNAENLITDSRKTTARALGCTPGEIYFTSGATESNNLALLGAVEARRRRGKRVITTTVEHPSVGHVFDYLEEQGFDVVRIPPRNGRFDTLDFSQSVTDDTILVSCMAVNNETGLHLPVEEISDQVKKINPDVLFHTDAVQAFCKIPLNVRSFPVDLLSVSGHKIYAPKGVGALYIKKGVRIIPRSFGGSQENSMRAGTEPVALICGFGEAVRQTAPLQEDAISRFAGLNKHLKDMLSKLPDITFNSDDSCVPCIVNFSVKGIRSEIMLHFLEQHGIYVSSGSACSKGEKSPVLEAMGFPAWRIDSAVRVSFSHETSQEDLERFVNALEQGIKQLARS